MKEVLRDLWRGKIYPYEERIFDTNKERELNRRIRVQKEKIASVIEETKLLDELEEYYSSLISFMQEEAFINGFSLAVKFIL